LELEGVFNAVCLGLSHVVSLRLLRHLARDTFFRGKVRVLLIEDMRLDVSGQKCPGFTPGVRIVVASPVFPKKA
ncbi:hypothetical protein, partial [Pseudomonas syringae]|uniref:hypothetical protein n=1 Tax=Pseudomonas syringae TaxID=317 RepID=UPI0024465D9A